MKMILKDDQIALKIRLSDEMKKIIVGSESFNNLVNRYDQGMSRVHKKVDNIINAVRTEGDRALVRYTNKFDKVLLAKKDLRVTEAEISGA